MPPKPTLLGTEILLDEAYEVGPTMTSLDFGCAKSREVTELREATAAIVESSLRWFPGISRSDETCSET